jgi:hypothetical protein
MRIVGGTGPNVVQTTAKNLVTRFLKAAPHNYLNGFGDLAGLAETSAILDADAATQATVLRECIDRIGATRDKLGPPHGMDPRYLNLHHQIEYPEAAAHLAGRLLRRKLPLEDADVVFLVNRTADLELVSTWSVPYLANLLSIVEQRADEVPVSLPMKKALRRLAASMQWIGNAPERKLCDRIELVCGQRSELPISAGEAWSDRAMHDVAGARSSEREAWISLLNLCARANGSSPSEKWLDHARSELAKFKLASFKRRLTDWFQLVDRPRTKPIEHWPEFAPDPNLLISEPHMQLLKGLAWACGLLDDEEVARSLMDLARSAFKKVPKIGPRAVKVGNACIWALGAMAGLHAVGQLSVLRSRVKFGTAQKMIEKAFTAAAEKLGLPRDEIEEMGVPSYGLEEVGARRDSFGDEITAELRARGNDVEVSWLRSDGKLQKSVPAIVKSDHKEEWKELQQAAKDIAAMLPAQAQRIDSMFLLQKRWPAKDWRERYLDHPLVGTIARRLVWTFRKGPSERFGIWGGKRLVNVDDEPLDVPSDAQVELWHPIGRPLDDVLAWRAWLERHQIRQPFKQAHREVYFLTDAERRTATYSNRFAAHVLRQHQFNALCAARGWKNKLRLMVDDSFPPASRELPNWGLRVEYWVEGIGDDYGRDTNESGVFLRVATDRSVFTVSLPRRTSLTRAVAVIRALPRDPAPET